MNGLSKQSWGSRYQTMGSTAEKAFLLKYPHAHRLGIDRPDFSVRKLPTFFRQAPDFLLQDGAYEVMGVSSRAEEPTLKLKHEKLDVLKEWAKYGPVHLWVWDSSRKTCVCMPIDAWEVLMKEYGEVKHFPDNNKAYWDLPIEHFKGYEE